MVDAGYIYWVVSVTVLGFTGYVLMYLLAAKIIDRAMPKNREKDQ